MDKNFEKDYEDFVAKRCVKALTESREYMELQEKLAEAFRNNDINEYSELNASIQIIVEKVCYKMCTKDMYTLFSEFDCNLSIFDSIGVWRSESI